MVTKTPRKVIRPANFVPTEQRATTGIRPGAAPAPQPAPAPTPSPQPAPSPAPSPSPTPTTKPAPSPTETLAEQAKRRGAENKAKAEGAEHRLSQGDIKAIKDAEAAGMIDGGNANAYFERDMRGEITGDDLSQINAFKEKFFKDSREEAVSKVSSAASVAQKQFMISLGVPFDQDLSKAEATVLITAALKKQDEEEIAQVAAPVSNEPQEERVANLGSARESINRQREREGQEAFQGTRGETTFSSGGAEEEVEEQPDTTIGDTVVKFGDTLSVVESLANFGLKSVLAKEILIAPFKQFERNFEAQVDTKAFAQTTLGKVLGLAGLAAEAAGIAAIGNIGSFSGSAITQTLNTKPILWTASAVVSSTGIMAWLASDNILSGGDIFLRDLKWNVISGAVSPADTRIILNQIDEWRDLATKFINAATIINPFLWPFRNLLIANADKSQLKVDVARAEVELEIAKLGG